MVADNNMDVTTINKNERYKTSTQKTPEQTHEYFKRKYC